MAAVKATVLHDFWDMEDEDHKVYVAGDEFVGTERRISGLEAKGFVERVKTRGTQKKTKSE